MPFSERDRSPWRPVSFVVHRDPFARDCLGIKKGLDINIKIKYTLIKT